MSFFSWFFNLSGDKTEEQVLCPFPHKTVNGLEYYESNPSASVNLDKGVFHCLSCGKGTNELQLMASVLGMKMSNAAKLMPAFSNTESLSEWISEGTTSTDIPLADSFGITKQVQEQLHLRTTNGLDILTPVFLYDKLVDIRKYVPNGEPKVKSRMGATNGIIVPFDVWRHSPKNRFTILCAGEKDMAVARSHGFNAICITGGETMAPIHLAEFEGRQVAIVYDNDEAGRKGAHKIATVLAKAGIPVKLVVSFHEGMQEKEDISDFFNKYKKTRDDLILYLENTPWFELSEEHLVKQVNLHQAAMPQNIGRLVKANIQVVAVADSTFVCPLEFTGTKTRPSDAVDQFMAEGETRSWSYDDERCEEILHLIDNNFKEKQIDENMRNLAHVPFKERNIRFKTYSRATVYKASVTDMFETAADSDELPMEFLVYSVNKRLESGKKYMATFKVVPHPYMGQMLLMIIVDVVQASDSITGFKITDETKESLDKFRQVIRTKGLQDGIQAYINKVKGILGYDGYSQLIETMDLAYHTPLQFNLGRFKEQRAYLDTIIVGESRVGKSSTAEALRKTYGLGTFVSLAGNSATVPGLIGGSNKVGGSYQTKAGLIPQNHKGLMIFEEFGKCKNDIVTELTDIRSSNEVRISRVSGSVTLPAIVRMISLSNVKNTSKEIKPIAAYPHGVAVVTELVGSAEDIARYDVMLVLGGKGNTNSDPFWEPEEPFPVQDYRNRIRWVWSRTADQILIDKEVGTHIAHQANELNRLYDTHIKVFGTEAWKKLARVAIAVACYTVSTDASYENVVVTKEHVDYAFNYFIKLYDNETFKLKEYVLHERKYSSIDADGINLLQEIYTTAPGALLHLEQEHKTNKAMLGAASGLDGPQLNRITNQLIQGMFVKVQGYDITPTERFRLGMASINRNTIIRRIGEIT